MERCERTDLLEAECDHCRRAKAATESPSWPALHEGECPTCGQRFGKGVTVKWRGDGMVEHAYHQ